MKQIKLTDVTRKELDTGMIVPVNVEAHTESIINDCFPEVKLLNRYSRGHGTLIRQTDEIMFLMCCHDEQANNIAAKQWIEVDGEFYDVDYTIQKLTDAGFDVENDL
ncbi:MAG: hypothetical protein IPL83_01360 [Bdellovibrionales bacterium]|nr:hypothetical protein [Bdellovibrionales bacterium]